MAKSIKPLSATKVKKAKPAEKQYTLFDGQGLFLLVTPTGSKLWRFKYRLNGKPKLMSFGAYPEVSLEQAREKRTAARKQVANGIDPCVVRRAVKESQAAGEGSFEVVAREWHQKFSSTWSESHAKTQLGRMERDLFPWLGDRPIVEITSPELLAVLRRIESRGALETAHRVKTICGQIFRYAIATGRAERDPAADLKGALPPVQATHHAAMTKPGDLADLLRTIDAYEGSHVVRCALRFAPLVFVRPGELRQAEWSEFDLDAGEWNIPVERMKLPKKTKIRRAGEAHLVPLSKQAVEILRDLQPLTGDGLYVFPSVRSAGRPMSDNTINAALRRLGYSKDEATGHGFRATARTILDEVLQVRPDLIEHQLAHSVRDPLGRAYNRTSFLPERREMMQLWADYLDGLKAGAKVIPISKRTASK
ncbi:integrase, bacteriophage P4-type [Syntrophotalea carbinolica DSM 2380]|uniref:Integrase, bacteriophage P4-type n=1 Tax=Syntrophotalea carbinolica (strain DSM 2380 / NBRC 103641 / GraBd1) TaxID=338963 RepID=Q3A3J3_SYNC1|nr:integrase arm-type DNA-binding domain-containing protein [Syntrophotalea carbinolica]ABA89064.1 integrase, bacteriophage P4-type [Syntrophotalea carbinolica DSM 2380]